MYKVLIFAGTTEGRSLAEFLSSNGIKVHACVATEYGGELITPNDNLEVSTHKLEQEEKCRLMKEYSIVVDATHPYATSISGHIREACEAAGAEYIRLLRPEGSGFEENVVYVQDVESAVDYLKGTRGNILVTTGSKDIAKYAQIADYEDRVYARVLSLPDVVRSCADSGFLGKNLIAMQGPFCEELNYGMLKQINASYMVTKDSGEIGGFKDKINAAKKADVITIVIKRSEEIGRSYEDVLGDLCNRFDITLVSEKKHISLVGIGVGPLSGVTKQAHDAIKRSDLIIGARRMISSVDTTGKDVLIEFRPDKIMDYLEANPKYRDIVYLLSGDVGFYSGAKSFFENVDRSIYDVNAICGISSVSYMCSKLDMPWQDVRLISAHGKSENYVGEVRRNKNVFMLMDSDNDPKNVCTVLKDNGLSDVTVSVGKDLGYPEERIYVGSPSEIIEMAPTGLCVAIISNPSPDTRNPISISDESFIRGDAPMTKSDIRSLSVAKLRLSDDSIIYDIGAGTGSVSVEMALCAVNGTVYAIEKEGSAADLIEQNKKKFKITNIEVIRGQAPESMIDLPTPTHAFIGGSSGNLKEIIEVLLRKNPDIRIVANAITLETISEMISCTKDLNLVQEDLISVSVSKSKKVGSYNMMIAQNPVTIITWSGSV